MKKIVLLIFAVTAFTATSAMAKSELKDTSAHVQNQNTADNAIHIKVSSIKITILRNSTFSKQDAIVSASIGAEMPSETRLAD